MVAYQVHLENITFADVVEDDLRLYSDQCFLNLFRLSQLLLEYLLNVQDALAVNLEVSNGSQRIGSLFEAEAQKVETVNYDETQNLHTERETEKER